jgi:hypothetical protein
MFAIHRIKAFENDQLHAIVTRLDQQLLDTRDIIVPPDFLFRNPSVGCPRLSNYD